MTGGCACGRIRFEAEIDSDEAYLCHCRMCQRGSGNVSLAMKNMPQDAVRWRHEPDWYRSSAIAQRPFCAACGTTLGFRYDTDTDGWIYRRGVRRSVAVQAGQPFRRGKHARAWIDTTELPRTRTDEYQKLVDRWEKAGAMPPESS